VDVHQDHIEGLFREPVQGVGSGGGPQAAMAEGPQDLLDDAQVHGIVVHMQDDQRTPDLRIGMRHRTTPLHSTANLPQEG
jgi:hypothetical protein